MANAEKMGVPKTRLSRSKSCSGSGTLESAENNNVDFMRSKSERDESAHSVSLETRKLAKNTKRNGQMLQADDDDEDLLILGEDIEPENFDLN